MFQFLDQNIQFQRIVSHLVFDKVNFLYNKTKQKTNPKRTLQWLTNNDYYKSVIKFLCKFLTQATSFENRLLRNLVIKAVIINTMVAPAIVNTEPFVTTSLKRNTLRILFKIKLYNARAEITKLHYWNSCTAITVVSMKKQVIRSTQFFNIRLVLKCSQ